MSNPQNSSREHPNTNNKLSHLQKITDKVPYLELRLLPLDGCDLVLAVEQLAKLGLIMWDFKNMKNGIYDKRKEKCAEEGNN